MEKLIVRLAGALVVIMWLVGGLFHFTTTAIAFSIGGFWAGMATFFIPGISTLYWFVVLFDISSMYTISGLVLIVWNLFLAIINK